MHEFLSPCLPDNIKKPEVNSGRSAGDYRTMKRALMSKKYVFSKVLMKRLLLQYISTIPNSALNIPCATLARI